MSDNDLRNEILQSTQRLMNQIDQIKPVEINSEEIEKSQAFINKIENEQIQNIEKSHLLLRDVTSWGDKRKDQYDEFEKPLLNTVEKSVHVSEEATNLAIPLLQEKIDNYDRRLEDLKSSIASMSDALTKSAKEKYENTKNGVDSKSENIPFFQFSENNNNNIQVENNDNDENPAEENIDASYDIIQSMKLREEHLMNVVQSMQAEMKTLKNSIKSEQSMSKNFHFELEYIKNHSYKPVLSVDEDSLIQHESIKTSNLSINDNELFEVPLIVIDHKDQCESTEELEKLNEKEEEEEAAKVILYQNFEVFDLDPNDNYEFLKSRVVEDIKSQYYSNLKEECIQTVAFESEEEEGKEKKEVSCESRSIETFEIASIFIPTVSKKKRKPIGKVTISKESGTDHHIFNYSENMNSDQVADDIDDLINFHRSCMNEEEEYDEYDEDDIENQSGDEIEDDNNIDENELKLQQLKLITDFKHAAAIVLNSKTGKRQIVTESNLRFDLEPTKDNNLFHFTSSNGQHLSVVLEDPKEKNDVEVKINLGADEVVDNRCAVLADEKNEDGHEIKLRVIVNKDGESYVKIDEVENSPLFFDSNGSCFVLDHSGSVRIPVVMNDTGQIMYEMANSEFIQVAMMNIQGDLFYINESGEKMKMQIDESGNFYVLSNSGQRIFIDVFKNLNGSNQKKAENPADESEKEKKRVKIVCDDDSNDKDEEADTDFNTDNLIPVSISRKDNELKIIYKDCEDAVVVNANISHTTSNGQMILRPKTYDNNSRPKQEANPNLAITGVSFDPKNDGIPGPRVTRIVGGFNKFFVRKSRRRKFNWSIRPARQIVKLDIEPRPPRCFFCQSSKERLAAEKAANANATASNPTASNVTAANPTMVKTTGATNKNTQLRWISFPVRPPPLCCRKGSHGDQLLLTVTPAAHHEATQKSEQKEKPKILPNKRKIVQPETKFRSAKDVGLFKSEQSSRKIINNYYRNLKFTASPSPRKPVHRQVRHLAPITPAAPVEMSVQPAQRVKFSLVADSSENGNVINSEIQHQNLNVSTIELPQF